MDETNPATAATEVAVECLTLWLEDPQQAINHIANLELDPSGPGATNLIIVGLLNLSSWLLVSLAETQGVATDVELQERATNILRKLSQRLTEERFDLHATTEAARARSESETSAGAGSLSPPAGGTAQRGERAAGEVTRVAGDAGSLAVAGATLTAAAAFQPLRRRVQDLVDRHFNRQRYDAARTVEVFAVRLREQVDLNVLSAELLAVVDHTVQPAEASLWLCPPATLLLPR